MAISDRIMLKLLIDSIVILIPVCLALFLKFFVEPFKRGFFCNDHNLMFPYKKDTVPGTLMDILGIIGGILIIIIVETKYHKTNVSSNSSSKTAKFFDWTITPHIQNLYHYISIFLFAEAIERCIEEGIKLTIGRLRPHFMDLCMPILSDESTCNDPQNINRYIENYTCSNINATDKSLRDIHMSFISGHTSFSVMTAFFCVFYLESRMKCRGATKMLKRLIQLILITGTIYIASSRISDYKHFHSDVYGGFVVGFSIAFSVSFYVSNMFKKKIVIETSTHI
ncbi:unnamed protein product [Chironomus riparius]|uniref:Phosphatidic acid phosphatase type 2/haloperoxidase domain-containing protein n=1 Tax=Chironomus riparius TaxID=315576 RepID=A0A9N9RZF8_9DIPT|nr:unnamed protein product [Chironomus riparius]